MSEKTPFKPLDETRPRRAHIKLLLISGAGFFADAYDLFAISVALVFLKQVWPLSPSEVALIAMAALLGATIGPFIFGRIGDIFGRKYIYGVEAALLTAGAIASALSINPTMLWISRFILGLGVGGDYPISATLMSEYSPARSRGLFVTGVFSMQGWGIITAALLGLGLLNLHVNPDIAWRVILGVGAVAPALVIYFRRRIYETPRFAYFVKQDLNEVKKAVKDVLNSEVEVPVNGINNGHKVHLRNYLTTILATAIPWFALDVFFYGTNIFGPFVTTALGLAKNPLAGIYTQLYIALAFLVPGYYVAALIVDRMGRKAMQIMGFAIVGTAYLAMALLLRHGLVIPSLILALYGLVQFFTNVGPNVTTFILPTELFPTRYRTTGHGIAAGSGKLGATLAALLIPILFPITSNISEAAKLTIMSNLLIVLATFALIGALLTLPIKEPRGKPLEVISGEV
ncbi:MFS transporter [Vulcanisaeta thermophila]|uniref:MFS transporter n=1 Tax=Vulcanisaeta thermophila TaxID=867917 RepID=UPI0008539620|nr:MFS transporter [Vulcanisaeta thermophila]